MNGRRTKDFIGKSMSINCKICGKQMTTFMEDLKRTPRRTVCRACVYEEENKDKWFRQ